MKRGVEKGFVRGRLNVREGRAYISDKFIRAVNNHSLPKSKIREWADITYQTFNQWEMKINMAGKTDEKVHALAKKVGIQPHEIFE